MLCTSDGKSAIIQDRLLEKINYHAASAVQESELNWVQRLAPVARKARRAACPLLTRQSRSKVNLDRMLHPHFAAMFAIAHTCAMKSNSVWNQPFHSLETTR